MKDEIIIENHMKKELEYLFKIIKFDNNDIEKLSL